MFTPAKLTVFLTAALSVVAMPSHMARSPHNHREIAARAAQPEVAPVVQIAARDMSVPAKRIVRKRAGTDRCKPNNSSDVPSSTVKEDPKPSSEPASPESSLNLKGGLNLHSTPKEDPKPSTSSTSKQSDPTPAPTPTPEEDPKPSTSSTSKESDSTPTPTSDPGNGGGTTYSGQATFYATGLGACGITNNDGEDIAAVSHEFFDKYPGYTSGNPNKNPMCGKTAKATIGGKSVYVKLTDRCEACAYGDLDFSPHAFEQIANKADGRVNGLTWQIVD